MKSILLKRGAYAIATALVIAFASTALMGTGSYNVLSISFWAVATPIVITAMFVTMMGVYTVHPVFHFKMFPMRGAVVGALVMLPSAVSWLAPPTAWTGFFAVLAVYAAYGFIIDIVATKFVGHGSKMLDPNNF